MGCCGSRPGVNEPGVNPQSTYGPYGALPRDQAQAFHQPAISAGPPPSGWLLPNTGAQQLPPGGHVYGSFYGPSDPGSYYGPAGPPGGPPFGSDPRQQAYQYYTGQQQQPQEQPRLHEWPPPPPQQQHSQRPGWQSPYQRLWGPVNQGAAGAAPGPGPGPGGGGLGRLGGGAGGAVMGGLGGLAAGMLLGSALSGDDGPGEFDAFGDGGDVF